MEETFIDENNGMLSTACNGDSECRQKLDTLGECAMYSGCDQNDDDDDDEDQDWQYSYGLFLYFIYKQKSK